MSWSKSIHEGVLPVKVQLVLWELVALIAKYSIG
jgi:hypothetical protein